MRSPLLATVLLGACFKSMPLTQPTDRVEKDALTGWASVGAECTKIMIKEEQKIQN